MGGAPPKLASLSFQLINIKSLIPFNLEFHPSNYSKWRELFFVALRRFNLMHHVDGKPNSTQEADWDQNDSMIVSWIYSSISDEVLGHILTPGTSTQALWSAIESLYRDNKQARILSLETELHNTSQGDMAIMAYCQRMKSIVDSLSDLG
ncbi:uncharacterized protein LOC133906012 [Phragmites australis]|uniref:uncharacterized protein LOC133906012 n=1 Tax=Phragmites australis TaxID=29695 RepID=UPI002D77C275|nr:uncharacterized protein LOC133906012 [Phragmites australis]